MGVLTKVQDVFELTSDCSNKGYSLRKLHQYSIIMMSLLHY